MSDDRDYTNGRITVHWRPAKCEKCHLCVEGLPLVFDVNRRPWVDLSQATDEQIAEQVEACPPQALSWSEAGDE